MTLKYNTTNDNMTSDIRDPVNGKESYNCFVAQS